MALRQSGWSAVAKRSPQCSNVARQKCRSKPVVLSEEQMAVVPRVATGVLPCELAQKVYCAGRHPEHAGAFCRGIRQAAVCDGARGYFDRSDSAGRCSPGCRLVAVGQQVHVDGSPARAAGLADACMSAEQQAVAVAMEKNPAPNLLEPLPRLARWGWCYEISSCSRR